MIAAVPARIVWETSARTIVHEPLRSFLVRMNTNHSSRKYIRTCFHGVDQPQIAIRPVNYVVVWIKTDVGTAKAAVRVFQNTSGRCYANHRIPGDGPDVTIGACREPSSRAGCEICCNRSRGSNLPNEAIAPVRLSRNSHLRKPKVAVWADDYSECLPRRDTRCIECHDACGDRVPGRGV